MKRSHNIIAILLLSFLVAGCRTQKKIVKQDYQSTISLPTKELPSTMQRVQSEKTDTMMNLFFPQAPKHEVRAVWLTTLGGLDWPTTKANTPERIIRQKAELTAILDKYQQAGINTVLFQTRIRGSVVYPSSLEPWDLGLTGQYNKNPGYDPLQFVIEECHKRGMEIQAWMVAIPLGKVSLNNGYGQASVVKKQKALCVRSGDEWFMDPGNPNTAKYLASLAAEIVSRYDIDGINLDYIRYPEAPYSIADKKNYRKYGNHLSLADWRRLNITNCVRAIYKAVKTCKPWVKVSSSPVGKYQDLSRYSSFGWNSRDKVYQEAEQWFKEGIHDEIFPMMYFDGKHFYPFASDWQENSNGRIVVPGLGIYFLDKSQKNWPLDVVSRQIGVIRRLQMGGQGYFRSRFLTDNVKGIYDYIKDRTYSTQALQPEMKWTASSAPAAPTEVTIQPIQNKFKKVSWKPVQQTDKAPVRYTVYASGSTPIDISNPHNILKASLTATSFIDSTFMADDLHRYYAVTVSNAYGKESQPTQIKNESTEELQTRDNNLIVPASLIKKIPNVEWFIIADAYGRQIVKAKKGTNIDISSLTTGYYKLLSVESSANDIKEVGYFTR